MVKIASVQAENVKRVKAVYMEPKPEGLTVIGGRNGQGKTSVLDAIAWALGGGRMAPTNPRREGAAGDPRLRVVMDNGLVVERKGKNSALKVTDPEGRKGGQQLLDSFIDGLALNLSRFMEAPDRDKAETLLRIVGVGDRLAELDRTCQEAYNQRLGVGQMERQKRHAAEEMTLWPGVPDAEVSASELIQRQSEILARNGENQRLRMRADQVEARRDAAANDAAALRASIEEMGRRLAEKEEELARLEADAATARKTAAQLQDESTAELEEQLRQVEEVNAKVRDNARRASALAEADELKGQYDDLTARIEQLRGERTALLEGARLPLPGLSVDDQARLTYNGQTWDCMSGSEQLRVATAIVRRLKPECGFVLVDGMEQMDAQTLAEFGTWAEGEGLQVIGTRVSTGDECTIVIEDGYGTLGTPASGAADAPEPAAAEPEPAAKWVMR